MMIPTSVYIEPKQETKIKAALRKKKGCRIQVRKPYGQNCTGLVKGELLLCTNQRKKYQKAVAGHTVALPFLHEHLVENTRRKGGFIPLLAALLAPVLGGVAGGLIEKEIAGSGIHPPKLVFCKKKSPPVAFQIEPAVHDGDGLYLSPWKGTHRVGTGLYLSPYPHKTGSGLKKLQHGMFSQCTQFSTPQKETLKSLVDLL